jgi:hypothetical protein
MCMELQYPEERRPVPLLFLFITGRIHVLGLALNFALTLALSLALSPARGVVSLPSLETRNPVPIKLITNHRGVRG